MLHQHNPTSAATAWHRPTFPFPTCPDKSLANAPRDMEPVILKVLHTAINQNEEDYVKNHSMGVRLIGTFIYCLADVCGHMHICFKYTSHTVWMLSFKIIRNDLNFFFLFDTHPTRTQTGDVLVLPQYFRFSVCRNSVTRPCWR